MFSIATLIVDSDKDGEDWEGGLITGDAEPVPGADNRERGTSLGKALLGSAVRFAGPGESDISLISLSNSAAAVPTSLG
jgi:hypothetical protein